MNSTPYARFTVAKENLWKKMLFRERQVLQAVLVNRSKNLFKVSDLIKLSALGSPATIHKALINLIESGHLKYCTMPGSDRSKFISLTKTSNTLFIKLNALFIACAT